MLLQTTSIPSCLHVQTSTSCTLNQSTSPVLVTRPWHSLTFRTYVGVSGVEAEGPGQGGVVSDWLIGRRQGQTYSPRSTCLTYCTVRVRSKCPRGTGFTGVVEGSSGGAIILFVTQGTLHWLNGTCKTMFKIIDIHTNSSEYLSYKSHYLIFQSAIFLYTSFTFIGLKRMLLITELQLQIH